MADNAYVKELRGLLKNDAVQTLMHVVPWAEGTIDNATPRDQGYKSLFGFNEDGSRRFMDSLDFIPDSPGKYRDPVTGQIKWSHDYGLYQLNKMNIPRLQKKIGRTDFSPETQDLMFLALLDEQPGFRKAISDGDPKTWSEGQWKKLLGITGKVYDSFPNGPGKGGKRTEAFLFSKVNEYLQGHGAKPVKYTGPSVQNTSATGTSSKRAGTTVDFLSPALDNILGGKRGTSSFLENTIRDVQGKNYANAGDIPFEVANTARSTQSVFGTMDTDPQVLVNRLFNQDPNTSYGLSFVGSSLRPTVNTVNADGNQVNMIELPNGRFINAETGERMNEDGSVYVEPVEPDNSEVYLVDDLNTTSLPQQVEQSEETALSIGSTPRPVNVGSAVSSDATGNTIAYVDPNAQVVNALGGDPLTRGYNLSRDFNTNAKALFQAIGNPNDNSRLA